MRLGHKIKLKPTENYFKNVIFSGQYHDENIFMISPFIKNGSTIIDIGANIGLYSCAYAQLYKNLNIKIYSIEAVTNNSKLLDENIKLNNFENIVSHNIALGKEKGTLEITLPSKNYVGNAVGDNIAENELSHKKTASESFVNKVDMLTLDEWAEQNQVSDCDFIKIDIEGAEFFAFQGGKIFIEKKPTGDSSRV